MNNEQLAQEILKITGPTANIISAQNCMTRLRLRVHEETFRPEQLKKLPGVLGLNKVDDEWQIILGPGKAAAVTKIFQQLLKQEAVQKLSKISQPASPPSTPSDLTTPPSTLVPPAQFGDGARLHAAIRKKNATPGKLLLKQIAHIFVPIIPAFIACGLITGLLNIALKLQPELASLAWIKILSLAGNAVFWGLNLFVGVNAAQEFGGTPVLGGVMAAVISHPGLSQVTWWGEPLVPGRGGIFAVLLLAFFTAKLEKFLHRVIPESLDLFLTPLLAVLISTAAAICIFQPVGGWLSEVIGFAATEAIGRGGAITGFILGGTFLPMVMLGIHQGLTPIHAELLNRYGVTILLPILAMAGGGQVGAACAVYLKTKNHRLKKTIASALPVGLMGIGEPLIYGVTLPLGKPFIGACIGGACGGAVQAAYMVGAAAMGISGLPLAASTNNIPVYLVGLVTAYAGGFIAAYLIGFDDPA